MVNKIFATLFISKEHIPSFVKTLTVIKLNISSSSAIIKLLNDSSFLFLFLGFLQASISSSLRKLLISFYYRTDKVLIINSFFITLIVVQLVDLICIYCGWSHRRMESGAMEVSQASQVCIFRHLHFVLKYIKYFYA